MYPRNCYIFVFFYLNIFCISCEDGHSLVFVIDNSHSTFDDQYKETAKAILDMFVAVVPDTNAFSLVTFNDPDVILRVKTNSTLNFKKSLDRIYVQNSNSNVDCSEMALTALETGLLSSRNGSYIYMLTDASAKDYNKVDTVKALIREKQARVTIILTGDCGSRSSNEYEVYRKIVDGIGDQVYHVERNRDPSILPQLRAILTQASNVTIRGDKKF